MSGVSPLATPSAVVANPSPVVYAGEDVQTDLGQSALLDGGVTVNSGKASSLTTMWSKVSGPGDVTFEDASAIDTTAGFSASGTYVLQLTAASGTLSASDQVTVTVNQVQLVELPKAISLEAESGTLSGSMTRRSDAGALGGSYVATNTAEQGTVKFDFDITQAGDYAIWARVMAPNSGQDSFYVSVDGGPEDVFDAGEGTWGSGWQWSAVNGRGGTGQPLTLDPRVLTLSAGHHTVTFRGREAGTGLDRIVISQETDAVPNQAPLVEAGMNQSILLSAALALAGTVSDDGLPSTSSGVTTTWTAVSGPGSVTFANASSPVTTARFSKAGTYVLRLTANDGSLVGKDELTVTVAAPPTTTGPIRLEAESGKLTAPMTTNSDSRALGGKYISTSTANQGTAQWTFNAAQAGNYVVWARVLAPTSGQDSFYVSVDGGPEDVFDAAEGTWSSDWQWTRVNGRGTAGQPNTLNPRVFNLAAGTHTITFRGREAGTGVDQILITNDATLTMNQAPAVNAGADQKISLPAGATLDGTVTDDGKPGPVSSVWTKVSGPGTVTFANAKAVDTTAQFSAAGDYVLKLTASDGELTGSDQVTVSVAPAPQSVTGFFVSPNGSPSGDGSINNPWDLKTALAQPGAVTPGSTIWLRGGTYRGGLVSELNGTADKPIVVRAYPGERVTIDTYDGNPNSTANTEFKVNGSHTWFWGLEVMNSNPHTRVSQDTGPWASDEGRGGITNMGSDNKFINLVIHDLGVGIGTWSSGVGGDVYGSIIYNNGYVQQDGHPWGVGIYTQNKDGTKKITDNIVFNNFTFGMQVYGSEAAYINGYDIEGNTFFNAGAAMGQGYQRSTEMLVGGGAPAQNITVRGNRTYHDDQNNTQSGVVDLGYAYGVDNKDLTLTNNYFATDLRFWQNWSTINAQGNTVVGEISGNHPSSGFSTTSSPHGTQVFVEPNAYEAGRANVTVYNWDKASSVKVDLSKVLTVGSRYEIRNVYDIYGAPVISGVYDGSPVSLPMKATTAPRPIGGQDLKAPVVLGPEFGAFVVTTSGAAASQSLMAAAGDVVPAAQTDTLTPEQLAPVVEYAASQWAKTGLTSAQAAALKNAQVLVSDLPGSQLGQATSQTITLDSNGAGHGWFIDPTPAQAEEFTPAGSQSLEASAGSAARQRVDLVTAVMHEMGHVLGYDHAGSGAKSDALMAETLATGVRKELRISAVDMVLADADIDDLGFSWQRRSQ